VSEGHNVEAAHQLSERHDADPSPGRSIEILEIFEVVLLAIVAVATAWSGYQAAQWDGHQAFEYGTASRLHAQANQVATLGGQQRLLDVSTFNTWIQAHEEGNDTLADLYVKRFSPEYLVAFKAWLKTHPFTNPNAPAGPIFMPEYHNAKTELAAKLDEHGSEAFDEGTEARDNADRYVRQTVLLATALFLIAIAQRFRVRGVRIAAGILAVVLMLYAVAGVVSLPRL